MNFAELRFWGYLLLGLAVIGGVRLVLRQRLEERIPIFDQCALATLGLFLLGCVSWVSLIIYLAVSVGSYVSLRWLLTHPAQRHSRFLAVLIPLQLLPLGYYKYANFAVNDVAGFEFHALRDLVIPVGISFYSFQLIGFVVDTLAFKRPLPRFVDYMNFAGFFPQVVAGPIERRERLLPQIQQFRFRWMPEHLDQGVTFIVLGLFFKLCLADNFAALFDGSARTNAFLIWQANLFFGLRIYFDFAGYSLVAVGFARCLAVSLTLNFLSPYWALSCTEFWRRWHVTLSQWFRDYVYIPLGGSRVKRWALNILIVFVVSGIWHGAGWNFAIWGALHGAFLLLNRMLGPRLKLPAVIRWGLTMICVFFAWLSFYEVNIHALLQKMQTLVTPSGYRLEALHAAWSTWQGSTGIVSAFLLVLTGLVFAAEWYSAFRCREPYQFLRRPAVCVVLIVLTAFLSPTINNAFIYFAF